MWLSRPAISLRGLHGEMSRLLAYRRRYFRRRHRRCPVWTGVRRSQSLGVVRGRCGRDDTCGTPGKLAMLTPGFAIGPAEGEKVKAAWWISTVAWDRSCISNVGEDVG